MRCITNKHFNIFLHKVKGHSNDHFNDQTDELARLGPRFRFSVGLILGLLIILFLFNMGDLTRWNGTIRTLLNFYHTSTKAKWATSHAIKEVRLIMNFSRRKKFYVLNSIVFPYTLYKKWRKSVKKNKKIKYR